MATGRVLTGMILIGALAGTPALAEAQRQRDRSERRDQQREERRDWQRQRAVQRRIQVERRNFDSRRVYTRPYYSNRRYGRPVVIVPRVVRPRVVTVIPYRPYVYRPRLGLGAFYGAGGAYPYGYTPRGYYDPLPGRYYGGLRITDAPRDAQVFADGYYVGIVDDFDGVFQHLNLEAGPHNIEVRVPGFDDAIAFDVVIQSGRTITYRADW
jgi:Ni/Co efflux regulator RcnB